MFTARRSLEMANGATVTFTVVGDTQAAADARVDEIIKVKPPGFWSYLPAWFRSDRRAKSAIHHPRTVAMNQLANALFACAAIGAATALVITGHTAESFWGWPLYGWLYGLGVFAVTI